MNNYALITGNIWTYFFFLSSLSLFFIIIIIVSRYIVINVRE